MNMVFLRSALGTIALGAAASFTATASVAAPREPWVATWTAPPQAIWQADFPLPANAPEVLRAQTVRQVVRVSRGGQRLRIALSNAYGTTPLTIGAASVAYAGSGGRIVPGSARTLRFGGNASATVPPGASLSSGPVDIAVPALGRLAVDLFLPAATPVTTFHWDGRQTAYVAAGNQSGKPVFAHQTTTAVRLFLTGVHVADRHPRAVAVLGDSITDGNGATVDADTRWPDFLAARLAPHGVAVLNAGISGGRLLTDGMGVSALSRLERDVLNQPGIRALVVLIGINDISWPGTAFAPKATMPTADALIAGYRELIARSRARGIRVVGATLLPFEGALQGTPLADYYAESKERLRQAVNAWIRSSGAFDTVVDFDAALRDPRHPARLHSDFDSGDHLHPGDRGHRAMADAIDLRILLPTLTE